MNHKDHYFKFQKNWIWDAQGRWRPRSSEDFLSSFFFIIISDHISPPKCGKSWPCMRGASRSVRWKGRHTGTLDEQGKKPVALLHFMQNNATHYSQTLRLIIEWTLAQIEMKRSCWYLYPFYQLRNFSYTLVHFQANPFRRRLSCILVSSRARDLQFTQILFLLFSSSSLI